ncbi:hypothetical protein Bca52824_018749 [Brassica carinata]|uniref:Uncharacterized protein n=1 Tax=Brassica carinata TaxID=52824 RepID=A0A8X8AZR7_BRACI|nr:hypothetical protein Bca52824_018749 [Brassica carinata]
MKLNLPTLIRLPSGRRKPDSSDPSLHNAPVSVVLPSSNPPVRGLDLRQRRRFVDSQQFVETRRSPTNGFRHSWFGAESLRCRSSKRRSSGGKPRVSVVDGSVGLASDRLGSVCGFASGGDLDESKVLSGEGSDGVEDDDFDGSG